MSEPQVEDQIWRLKESSGAGTDKDLADRLGVNPSSVAAWRRRGKVPEKYLIRAAISQARAVIPNVVADEFSVHILAFFIDLIGRETSLRLLSASDELNLLYVARMFFALEQRLWKEAAAKRARTLEQQLAVLERFREDYTGINRLSDLVKALDL